MESNGKNKKRADGGASRGVAFLNATPFWGWMPRLEERRVGLLGTVLRWDGRVPAPAPVKAALRRLWDSFTREDNIRNILRTVYNHG